METKGNDAMYCLRLWEDSSQFDIKSRQILDLTWFLII
jgi:hypothetical protein